MRIYTRQTSTIVFCASLAATLLAAGCGAPTYTSERSMDSDLSPTSSAGVSWPLTTSPERPADVNSIRPDLNEPPR